MEKGLEDKTGKTLEEWIDIVRAAKLEKHGEILKFLKSEHGFTHGFANFVSLKARAADAASFSEDDLLSAQYKGKESLKPIYDKLHELMQQFGSDVEVVPKKANVSFKTAKQFALVQPSTKTRVDVGIKLKGVEPEGRLEGSGPFGAMCTHRVKITDPGEVNAELADWLKRAYEASK